MKLFLLLLFISSISLISCQTPQPCPGGDLIYQDIAVLYDLSFYPDDSLILSKLIQDAVGYIFTGASYSYDDFRGQRITQIITIPFPNSDQYNSVNDGYQTVNSSQALLDRLNREFSAANSSDSTPTDSSFSDALKYLNQFIQKSRRPSPVRNTVVIISKRDDDVDISQGIIDELKNSGTIIMTVGDGTVNTSQLASLASGSQYVFNIADYTNEISVDNAAQWIAQHLAQDCGFNTSAPIPTTMPTTTLLTSTGPSVASSSGSVGSTASATSTSSQTVSTASVSTASVSTTTTTSSATSYSLSFAFLVLLAFSF